LAENNINLIFAVTKNHYMLYKVCLEGERKAGNPILGALLTRRGMRDYNVYVWGEAKSVHSPSRGWEERESEERCKIALSGL
jgi:hypothetical protein